VRDISKQGGNILENTIAYNQGSKEWIGERIGNLGCSRLGDVLAQGKGGTPSATRKNYIAELLCERLTGNYIEHWQSEEMKRGIEKEGDARAEYEMRTGIEVVQDFGMFHPSIAHWRGSPDGLILKDGMIEVKNPLTATHIDTLLNGTIAIGYIYQMAGYVEIYDREWIDFVSFDDRLPDSLCYYSKRFYREDLPIEKVKEGAISFLSELDSLESRMRARM
jgi:hypothetical protein